MVNIRIPTPLRLYTGGQNSVAVSGSTVGEALVELTRQHPDLQPHLFDGEVLRSFVNIYLNKEDVRNLDGQQTAVSGSDTLMIIPSIAGGQSSSKEVELWLLQS